MGVREARKELGDGGECDHREPLSHKEHPLASTSTSLDKGAFVREMFARIAPRYDATNRVMTAGMDELWRRRAISLLAAPSEGQILDLCCGTGDLTLQLLRTDPTLHVTG